MNTGIYRVFNWIDENRGKLAGAIGAVVGYVVRDKVVPYFEKILEENAERQAKYLSKYLGQYMNNNGTYDNLERILQMQEKIFERLDYLESRLSKIEGEN